MRSQGGALRLTPWVQKLVTYRARCKPVKAYVRLIPQTRPLAHERTLGDLSTSCSAKRVVVHWLCTHVAPAVLCDTGAASGWPHQCVGFWRSDAGTCLANPVRVRTPSLS
jgi:hypothetical protein